MTDNDKSVSETLRSGDAASAEQLLPLVYDELRNIARRQMRREAQGHSLQTTGLVHEAYLRLVKPGEESEDDWKGQVHFLAAAAQAMRHILVDRARARGAAKRGGDLRRVEFLDAANITLDDVPPELLDLDEALTKLAVESPQKAELVTLRFFSGLTMKEVAAVMGISINTANRHWAYARAWMLVAMEQES